MTIEAIKDSFISEGKGCISDPEFRPDKNYGWDPYILITKPTENRVCSEYRGIISFGVINISPSKIQNVTLVLTQTKKLPWSCKFYRLKLRSFQIYPYNWSENDITWDLQPPIGNFIGKCLWSPNCCTGNYETPRYIDFDITDWVINQTKNKYPIDFFLVTDSWTSSDWNVIEIASKDHPNPYYHPKLIIEYEENETTTTSTTLTTSTTTSTLPTTTVSTTSTAPTTTTTTTTIETTTTIPQIRKPVFITDSDFWNILSASPYSFPLLVKDDTWSNSEIEKFIERYSPTEILCINTDYENCIHISRDQLKSLIPTQGTVIVDGDRKRAILGSYIAKLLNYSLVEILDVNGNDFYGNVICTFNFSSCSKILDSEEKLEDFIFNLTKGKEMNTIILTNVEKNESALASKIGGLPIVLDIKENYTDLTIDDVNTKNKIFDAVEIVNRTIQKMKDNGMISEDYLMNNSFFLILVGMPFAFVKDPYPELFHNMDGSVLVTDNLYGDCDKDGYLDLAVGRFCCSPSQISVQIENRRFWNPKEKRALVLAEYRKPPGKISFDGMSDGMITEGTLGSAGFNITRLVEWRAPNFTDTELSNLTLPDPTNMGIDDWIKYGEILMKVIEEWKYKLYEYNLLDLLLLRKPEKLPALNRINFFKYKNFSSLIFYFGMGDEDAWYLPGDNYDPYPKENNITPNEFDWTGPKMLIDEHTLAGQPTSRFVHCNNLVYLGPTGIVHDTISSITYRRFLEPLAKGKPIGEALREMKRFSLNYTNQSRPFLVSLIFYFNHKATLKDMYQLMLYGDPRLSIDPVNFHMETYRAEQNGNEMKIKVSMNPKWRIEQSENFLDVNVENADNFIFDLGRPLVPVLEREIILPSRADYHVDVQIHKLNESYVNPLILEPDQFSYNQSLNYTIFPEENYWIDERELLDGRKEIRIIFSPVKYIHNSSIKVEIYNATFEISYQSPLEILDLSADQDSIEIELKSNGLTKLLVQIVGEDKTELIRKDVEIHGTQKVSIPYHFDSGKYIIRVSTIRGNLRAGPKEISLSVGQQTTETTTSTTMISLLESGKKKIGLEKSTWIKRNFEEVKHFSSPSGETFIFRSFDKMIIINKTFENISFQYLTPDFSLIFSKNSKEKKYFYFTNKGSLIISESHGIKKEVRYGGISNEEFEKVIRMIKNIMISLKLTYIQSLEYET
ncbi:MAG: DNRLRE domain-containing protein [Candidatus Aenigmarchaeota archaeon]|nr:DNRLRE domain-containing protein [Candidatus Aenigmarchaeota archaeon]